MKNKAPKAIAICSMVRKPFNFDTWLEYHFNKGIEYIFLRVEDTPELKEIVDKYPNKVFAKYYNDIDNLNNYQTIQTRQANFIDETIEESKQLPIEWIFHIDSDELIWSKEPLLKILTPIPKRYGYVHLQNFEAVYPEDSLDNPFIKTNRFVGSGNGNLSYGNGKSVGRVSDSLKISCPHYFTGKVYELSNELASILHFDSMTFEIWYDKFSNLSNITEKNFKQIPFKFYRDSIEIIREGDVEIARAYYNKMKVDTYNKDNAITNDF